MSVLSTLSPVVLLHRPPAVRAPSFPHGQSVLPPAAHPQKGRVNTAQNAPTLDTLANGHIWSLCLPLPRWAVFPSLAARSSSAQAFKVAAVLQPPRHVAADRTEGLHRPLRIAAVVDALLAAFQGQVACSGERREGRARACKGDVSGCGSMADSGHVDAPARPDSAGHRPEKTTQPSPGSSAHVELPPTAPSDDICQFGTPAASAVGVSPALHAVKS